MKTDEDMRAFKNRLFEQLGILGGAFSSPKRLELLDILSQGERTVENLARQTGLSVSNVSQHLRILRNARLVKSTKDGLYVHYSVADPEIIAFWGSFRSLAVSHLAEIREAIRANLDDQDELTSLETKELQKLLAAGEVILLDVRPSEEYEAGHLPGALSVPLDKLREKLDELPRDREIIAYCHGLYCVMALEAVKILREKGFKARRFETGLPEWRAMGLPVEEE